MRPHLIDRRTFLRGSLVVGGGVVAASAPSGVWAARAAADDDHVRVYVVVVDGLRPDQVSRMPFLASLRDEGTFLPESRAQMVAETTPNHISMLTGVRADRHGMPGNAVPGLEDRVSDDRRYLKADTLFTLAARQAPDLRTAAATSKDYIVETSKADRTGDGAEDATETNDPVLSIPGSDAAPDIEVGAEALRLSRDLDPDFLFVNLGDVDRVGHVDLSGGLLSGTPLAGVQPVAQLAALTSADLQIRLLVEELRASGRWERTVLLVTADHSMDWSMLDRQVDLADAFEADELLRDEVVVAANGGAALYALRAPDEPQADERLRRMRTIAAGTLGVREALYLRDDPADGGGEHTVARRFPDWGLGGDLTGELIVTVEAGYRIGHGGPVSNPIPGNHGHEATLPIPMLITGGWDGLADPKVVVPDGPAGRTDRSPNQGENIDVAPTVAWLLGLNPPPGGFDGRVLSEAFTRRPAPRVVVANVASVPLFDALGPDGAVDASVAISAEAFTTAGDAGRAPSLPLIVGDELAGDQVLPLPGGGGQATVLLGPADAPDRLVGAGPLGAALGAPLLLVPSADTLPEQVADELARLDPARVLLLGGEDVLSAAIADAAGAGGADVVRFDGDGAEVAAACARELGVADGSREVVLAGDPQVAAAAQGAALRRARPVLVANSLPTATAEVLDELGIDRIVDAGGALDDATTTALRDAGTLVEPIVARDGRDVARRLAERAVREGALTDDLYLAADAATALAAAPAVARLGGSLLALDGEVPSFVVDRSDEFVRVRFLGAVPAELRAAIEDAIRTRRARGADLPHPEPAPVAPAPPSDDGPAVPDTRPTASTRPLPVTGSATGLLGLGALGLAAVLRARTRRSDEDA